MWLIATDEAGYGPTLGPLVVCASVWKIEARELVAALSACRGDQDRRVAELAQAFAPVAAPIRIGGVNLRVDDSKTVFQSKGRRGGTVLHGVFQAALASIRYPAVGGFDDVLDSLCPRDHGEIFRTPWLAADIKPAADQRTHDWTRLAPRDVETVRHQWQTAPVRLVDFKMRVLTAAAFNRGCRQEGNKANLLSRATLGLAAECMDACVDEVDSSATGQPIQTDPIQTAEVQIFCDRFGGRRYYAEPLAEAMPSATITTAEEHSTRSRYRMVMKSGRTASVDFTVKGDRFTPVAFSSMIAKYTRERLMRRFNDYFGRRYATIVSAEAPPLRPTAGYPQDAARFLADIESVIDADGIDRDALIRHR